jgi:hypothetical protein
VRLLKLTNVHNSWLMNTIHNFHTSVESISQSWNLFHQVRNEGTFFTTLEFISPGNLQEQISHQWNLYNIIFLWNMFYQNIYHRKLFLGKLFSQELILAHTSTLKQQSAARHVAPLEHIILIPSKPVFALSP